MEIKVQGIYKAFSGRGNNNAKVMAVNGITLAVGSGKMLALVGPSGSGKTTLLRCIAGLEAPDQGDIRIGDQRVYSSSPPINIPPDRRNLGLIFQSYALWPNMTVERNVDYPLRRRRIPEEERRERVAKYLGLVGCGHLADRYPHELSGGQQQRIALARALVYEPAIVLFDEPLSNLDTVLREHLRSEIRDLQRAMGFTGVYVTHDQNEAFFVGDQVAILSAGDLIQFGTPDEIYRHPADPGVARFVGATNQTPGRLSDSGQIFESADLGRLRFKHPRSMASPQQDLVLMARPESIKLQAREQDGPLSLVRDRVLAGSVFEYVVELPSGQRWRVRSDIRAPRFDVGTEVAIEFNEDEIFLFPADVTSRLKVGGA